jgi:ISXO2-like transposase domain
VLERIARDSEVHTDAYSGYAELDRLRYRHVITNLSEAGDPAHVLLPNVHLVASLVKRWILGTHQGAVSHDQLDWYLDEYTFRFNRRRSRHRGLLFYRLIEGALAADPSPYRTLIAA